jgi:hypothetical protein
MASLAFTVVVNKRTKRPQSAHQHGQNSSRHHSKGHQFNKRKQFCKCCFDAGKDEAAYTSHYLKDKPGPQGKVVCPTLLATECRYCHEVGHYKSHCPILKERKITGSSRRMVAKPTTRASFVSDALFAKIKAAEANVTFRQKQEKTGPAKKNNNAFAVLEDDNDDRKLPSIPTVVKPVALQGKWTAPLGSSEQPSDNELFALKRAHTVAPKEELVVEKQARSTLPSTPQLWADMCSSDEEDDEEDDEEITHDANGFPSTDNSAW